MEETSHSSTGNQNKESRWDEPWTNSYHPDARDYQQMSKACKAYYDPITKNPPLRTQNAETP